LNAFHENVARQGTRNAGEQYAQEQQQQQQAIAGEQATAEFLKTLRAHYDGANRGDQFWTTFTRKSTNNPEESIEIPGILNILNIPVQLYAPVPSKTRRPVSPRQQQLTPLSRAQAGVGRGPGLRLWQLLVRNLNSFRNIKSSEMLLTSLGQIGTAVVMAARQRTGLNVFDNPDFSMSADEVGTIALQMLQNPLLRDRIQVNPPAAATYTESSARKAFQDINGGKKRGGRRTRKHKKRRKKTRHRRKRGKKTRHKKKKRTRKH